MTSFDRFLSQLPVVGGKIIVLILHNFGQLD